MPNDELDIAVLFARDPLKHSDEDIDRIIKKFRDARSTFKATGKAPTAKKAGKKPAVEVDASSLGDLLG